jgi:hypothetical protein
MIIYINIIEVCLNLMIWLETVYMKFQLLPKVVKVEANVPVRTVHLQNAGFQETTTHIYRAIIPVNLRTWLETV